MFRSIVARSQPLFSPGGAILPSRAYATSSIPSARLNESDDETMEDRHLYMVLRENAMSRFSIYKLPGVDEDPLILKDGEEALRSLPPATIYLGFTLVGLSPQFEAVGSKIAIYGEADTISQERDICQFITLLYDTKRGTLDGGRALSHRLDELWIKSGYHAAAPVGGGDKLCVLEAEGNKPFYLYEEPKEVNFYLDEWVWEQGRSPLPLDATGRGINIESHAVHPDGRTVFASSTFTFSLDMDSGESARHGDWRLPFHGRAYYDSDLDAWVGIRVADGTEGGTIKGCPYLCACQVPTALANGTMLSEPAWKMCKEELRFVKAPTPGRSPTLVHTGPGNFYLVEVSDGARARVTRLCVKRAKNGELEVTWYEPARSFLLPNYSGGLLTAFWM